MTTRKPIGFDAKLQASIELLKKAEPLALRYSEGGYYLAFSGGKDSQALYHVAQKAGVKFEAHMNHDGYIIEGQYQTELCGERVDYRLIKDLNSLMFKCRYRTFGRIPYGNHVPVSADWSYIENK